jgi:hypothetical protein
VTPEQLNSLVMTLAGATALCRLAHSEQHAVFTKLIELGFTIVPTVPPAPVAA